MACCAIAAFLFGQIYLGLMGLRCWLSGADVNAVAAPRADAARWRPGGQAQDASAPQAAAAAAGRGRWLAYSPARVGFVVLLSLCALATVAAAERIDTLNRAGQAARLLDGLLCGAKTWPRGR